MIHIYVRARDNKVRLFVELVVCTLPCWPTLRHRGAPRKHLVCVRQQRSTKQVSVIGFPLLIFRFFLTKNQEKDEKEEKEEIGMLRVPHGLLHVEFPDLGNMNRNVTRT